MPGAEAGLEPDVRALGAPPLRDAASRLERDDVVGVAVDDQGRDARLEPDADALRLDDVGQPRLAHVVDDGPPVDRERAGLREGVLEHRLDGALVLELTHQGDALGVGELLQGDVVRVGDGADGVAHEADVEGAVELLGDHLEVTGDTSRGRADDLELRRIAGGQLRGRGRGATALRVPRQGDR